jgi:hypothetical protein
MCVGVALFRQVCTLEDYDVDAEATLEAFVPMLGMPETLASPKPET